MADIDAWATKSLDFLDKAGFGLSLGTKGAIATHEWRMDAMSMEPVAGPEVQATLEQSSAYGVVIPRLYGRVCLGGNIFWLKNNKIDIRRRVIAAETSGGGS